MYSIVYIKYAVYHLVNSTGYFYIHVSAAQGQNTNFCT